MSNLIMNIYYNVNMNSFDEKEHENFIKREVEIAVV